MDPSGDGPSTSAPAGGAREFRFTEHGPDATIHFQVIDLGRQLFVWVSASGNKLSNLYMAVQTKLDQVPSVATLLPGGAASESKSLAQRLALKLRVPVMCSSNLPANSPLLQAIAERRLLKELGAIVASSPALSAAASQAAAAQGQGRGSPQQRECQLLMEQGRAARQQC